MPGALGRRVPTDWEHYDKYPLTAETLPKMPVPVVLGINWYSNFDNPVWKSGRWWIGLDSRNLGTIRGGHCVCLEPGDQLDPVTKKIVTRLQDTSTWYGFYDQGNEGACVGFGSSRMMTLLNRKQYWARWLWDQAKATDEWPDTNPGDDNGTSVRAGLDVLANRGHVPWKASYSSLDDQPSDYRQRDQVPAVVAEGISVYRWASTVDEVQAALQSPANQRSGAVRILNSWGTGYPQRVWMPNETLQRIIDENGEVGLVTDR